MSTFQFTFILAFLVVGFRELFACHPALRDAEAPIRQATTLLAVIIQLLMAWVIAAICAWLRP